MPACGVATFDKRGEKSYFLQATLQKEVDRLPQESPEWRSCFTKWYFLTVGRKEPNLNIMWEMLVHSKMFTRFKTILYSICLVACEAAYYSRRSHEKMVLSSDQNEKT